MWGFPNIATAFALILTNAQFIGLLSNIDIPWPNEWSNSFDYFNLLNLDLVDVIGEGGVTVVDYRTLFMIVAIMVPLLLNICVLLLYKEISRIVWYVTLIFGMVILLAGALGRLLPSAGVSENESTSNLYLIIGGFCVLLALGAALAFTLYRRYVPEDDNIIAIHKIHVETKKFHRQRTFLQFGVSMLCMIVGVVLLEIVDLHIDALAVATNSLGGFILALGWFFLIFGGLMLIYFGMNLCRAGRIVVDKIHTFLKANLLLLLLIAVNSSIIPVQQYSMNMYMCQTYTCPAGYVFNPYASRPTSSYDYSVARFCDPCTFVNPSCGTGNVTALCPGFSGYRNWQNPEVPCDDESVTYFYISAAICLLAYSLAIPYMYKNIIDVIVTVLQRSVVVDPSMNEEEHWERQTLACCPAAANLYEPFFIHKRYYILMWLLQRLLVVATLVIIAPYSDSAAAVVFALFFVVCIMTAVNHPIMNHYEMGLYMALTVCNLTNGIFAMWVWLSDGKVSPDVSITFVLLNVALPVAVVIVMKGIHALYSEQWDAEEMQRAKSRKAQYRRAVLEQEGDRSDEERGSEGWQEDWESDGWSDGSVSSNSSPRMGGVRPSPMNPANMEGSFGRNSQRSRSPSSRRKAEEEARSPKKQIQISMEEDDEDHEPVDTAGPSQLTGEAISQRARIHNDKLSKRKKLKKVRKQALAKLKETLNKATGDMFSNFFMIIGVFFFLALGSAVLGTLRQDTSAYVVGHNVLNRGIDYTLASYPTWEDLTSDCCCLNSNNPSVNFNVTERWVCNNGRILDKGRVSKRLINNATDFRGVCAETPNAALASCVIETVNGGARMACSEVDRAVYPDVTSTAFSYYW